MPNTTRKPAMGEDKAAEFLRIAADILETSEKLCILQGLKTSIHPENVGRGTRLMRQIAQDFEDRLYIRNPNL